jgi:ABC-type phosphate transport system substrate-binding protein
MKALLRVLILLSIVYMQTNADEYVVIANKNAQTLSIEQIKAIYLKKLLIVNDVNIIALNLDSGDALRDEFNNKILKMGVSRLQTYWSKQHYLGHRPPLSLKSQESVKAFVKKVDGSIGYINKKNIDDEVRILYQWRD